MLSLTPYVLRLVLTCPCPPGTDDISQLVHDFLYNMIYVLVWEAIIWSAYIFSKKRTPYLTVSACLLC